MILKSDEENPLNNDEFRRTIVLDMCTDATGEEIMGTFSSPGVKLEPGTPASPGKCAGEEHRLMGQRCMRCTDIHVEILSLPDVLREREGRGDRSNPSNLSDNSDFNNSGNCSSSGSDDEVYQESDDDDHVTRQPRKRRKLWTWQSSRSVVTSDTCTGDPSPTAVVNNKPGKWNPTMKYDKNPVSDSSSVSTVPLDDAVMNQSGNSIPVSGFLSSYVAGSKVCYTITFCHKETGRLLSANANKDDALLKELKEGGEPWDEITKHFPGRSKATLQVQYSTKLKLRTPLPTRKLKSKLRLRKHGCL
ncbi:hypothetical protein, variant [Blastomyces dermatitidis ATCC 26199]|nr:hypothetical protein BDFG_05132 [Blastomyces dermatitidis ATCC 26199]EQL32744.1 hypothetical protein, variant [Blastomyces dermatitidis ATCC 26199]